MTTRRATQVGVQVETLPGAYRRATQVGVQVETLPGAYRRLTQLAVMLELTAAMVLPSDNFTPQIEGGLLSPDQPQVYGWTFTPLPADAVADAIAAAQLVADLTAYLHRDATADYQITVAPTPGSMYEAGAWFPVIDATYLPFDATVIYQHVHVPLPAQVTFTLTGVHVSGVLRQAGVTNRRRAVGVRSD